MGIPQKERVAWLDIAKAITILMVVFGHTLRSGMGHQIVYSFHVATFFFLSGMTSGADNLSRRIKNDFLRIMIPYYSFSIISILIYAVLGSFAADSLGLSVDTSFGHSLAGMLYACPVNGSMQYNMPLWFLPCLFATKIIYYASCKLCRGNHHKVFLFSIVLAGIGFVYTYLGGPRLPFHISVALKMVFFFSLGRIIFLWLAKPRTTFIKRPLAIILGTALLIATGVIAVFTPAINYSSDRFPNLATFLLTALMGSFGVCTLSIGLCKCRWIERIGKTTLVILVIHKFPVLVFQTIGPQKVFLEQYDTPAGIITALFVSLITIALCVFADWILRMFFPFLLGDFSKYRSRRDLRKERDETRRN